MVVMEVVCWDLEMKVGSNFQVGDGDSDNGEGVLGRGVVVVVMMMMVLVWQKRRFGNNTGNGGRRF